MRLFLIVLLVVSSSACYSYHLASAGPREVIEREPNVVRVTGPDGSVTLAGPRIVGDSIRGTLPGPRRLVRTVSVDEVRTIEVGEIDANKTVPTLIGIPFLVFALPGIFYLACCANGAP